MGFVSDAVGGITGAAGGILGSATNGLFDPLTHSNFQAAGAPIVNPVTGEQIDTSYKNTQTGLQQQQDFLTALQAQNGIANQSAVFNQQQGLANQLQGVANGTGPNPAQAALNQATSANIAQQAALMAGQRGTSQNAGLLARQASQQGGALQQQAAGQGATMQAQQQLNAMAALGNQQANMANVATNQVGQQAGATNAYANTALNQQSNLLGAQAAFNNAAVGSTSSQNSANAGIAGQQLGAKMGLLQGAGSAAAMSDERVKTNIKPGDSKLNELLEHSNPHSYQYKNPELPGAGEGTYVSPMAQDLEKSEIGKSMVTDTPQGKMVDYGKGMGAMLAAQSMLHEKIKHLESQLKGHKAPVKMAEGGNVNYNMQGMADFEKSASQPAPTVMIADQNKPAANGAKSKIGQAMANWGQQTAPSPGQQNTPYGQGYGAGQSMVGGIKKLFGSSDSSATPSMQGASPDQAFAMMASKGAVVPGKAKKKGNSYDNDTVPAMLSPGEIVLPRSVTQSDDPVRHAAQFVQDILAKHAGKPLKSKKKA